MGSVSGYDAFEIISADLDLTTEQLLVTACQNPEDFKRDLRQSGLERLPFILEQDLLISGGKAPVLAKGMNLMENIDAVFRILQLGQSFVNSPRVKADKRLDKFLKNKIKKELARLIGRIKSSKKLGPLFHRAEKIKDFQYLSNNLSEALNNYLSGAEVISAFWSSLRDRKKSCLMEDSVNAALLAMIAMTDYTKKEGLMPKTLRRSKITNAGLSCLCQDLAVLTYRGHEIIDHEIESARMAAEMGFPDECVQAIANHHRVVDNQGRPILETGNPGIFERVLVCVNYFLRCVMKKFYNLSLDEAVYVMNHYARRCYFDNKIVMSLAMMGIGGFKSRIIALAEEILSQNDCGHQPFLWDVNAAIPNRIICKQKDCRHAGSQQVQLYYPVLFETAGYRFKIPAGKYRYCSKLTGRLAKMIVQVYRCFH